jgi:DNA-binding NarL/FixJ family response regulator
MTRKIKIVLTDTQELFRAGLRDLFRSHPQFEIISETNNGEDLFKVLRKADPDLILLDSSLPDGESRKLTSMIAKKFPDVKVVILGVQASEEVIYDFVILGAKAYLFRDLKAEEFIKMICLVNEQHMAIDDKILKLLLDRNNGINAADKLNKWLTEKEREVYVHLKTGKNACEIAELLNIAISTVHTHKKNMFKKSGTHSVAELINFINEKGWG